MAFKHPTIPTRVFQFHVHKTPEDYYQDPFILYRSDTPKEDRIGELAGEFQATVRQGTFGEDKARAEIAWQRTRKYTSDEAGSTEIVSWTPQGLWEMDLSLCIVDLSDLEYEGVDTPKFVGTGSSRHAEDRQKLLAFLRALPSQWITALHDAVLEVNPKWDPKRG